MIGPLNENLNLANALAAFSKTLFGAAPITITKSGSTETDSGGTTTTVKGTTLTPEAINAMLREMTEGGLSGQGSNGIAGLAAIMSGQKAAGLYNSATTMQLMNKNVANIAEKAALASTPTTVTETKPPTTKTTTPTTQTTNSPGILATPAGKYGALLAGAGLLKNKKFKKMLGFDEIDKALGEDVIPQSTENFNRSVESDSNGDYGGSSRDSNLTPETADRYVSPDSNISEYVNNFDSFENNFDSFENNFDSSLSISNLGDNEIVNTVTDSVVEYANEFLGSSEIAVDAGIDFASDFASDAGSDFFGDVLGSTGDSGFDFSEIFDFFSFKDGGLVPGYASGGLFAPRKPNSTVNRRNPPLPEVIRSLKQKEIIAPINTEITPTTTSRIIEAPLNRIPPTHKSPTGTVKIAEAPLNRRPPAPVIPSEEIFSGGVDMANDAFGTNPNGVAPSLGIIGSLISMNPIGIISAMVQAQMATDALNAVTDTTMGVTAGISNGMFGPDNTPEQGITPDPVGTVSVEGITTDPNQGPGSPDAGTGTGAADGDASDAGWKSGGKVHGPGTGTSDSINAKLSAGEFIIPADVVKIIGTDYFEELIEKYHTPVRQQRRMR